MAAMDRQLQREMESLRGIFQAADQDGSGELDRAEFDQALRKRHVKNMLAAIEVPLGDMQELYVLLDADNVGTISVDEFMTGCLKLKGVARAKDMMCLSMLVTSQIDEARRAGDQLDDMGIVMDRVVGRLMYMEREYFRGSVKKPDFDAEREKTFANRGITPKSRGAGGRERGRQVLPVSGVARVALGRAACSTSRATGGLVEPMSSTS